MKTAFRVNLLRLLFVTLGMLSFSLVCQAGVLFSIGPNWNNFVFEPEAKEDTPNYYGYGGRIAWGYSVAQVFDLGLYTHYTPGQLKEASVMDADASLLDYGAELGVRIFDLLYIGTRAGVWKYQLFKSKEDGEIAGKWMGLGGSASVGMIMPISKRASWQTSLDLGQATMRKVNNTATDTSTGNKKLSRISITVGFVYNDDDTESGSVKLLRSYF